MKNTLPCEGEWRLLSPRGDRGAPGLPTAAFGLFRAAICTSACTSLLVACGGGSAPQSGPAALPPAPPASSPSPPPPPLPPSTATKLLVIGNSLTYVPIRPELGWMHAGGMAASDAAHDFVHLAAATLGLEPDAQNFYPLEVYPTAPVNLEQIPTYGAMADAQTDVVVEQWDDV